MVLCGFKNICAVKEKSIQLPEKFFLFVGVMKERKNVLNVVRAFFMICKEFPEYMLVLGGKAQGEYVERIKEYILHEGIESRVIWIGHLNDSELSFVYRRACALVFASFIEGFGYPVLEAMACGTPVITSRFTSLGEICKNESALLVDPADMREIAGAMKRMIQETELRASLVDHGYEQVKKFSWEKAGKDMVECILSLRGVAVTKQSFYE